MRELLFRGQTRRKGEKVRLDGTPIDSNWVYGGVAQLNEERAMIYQTEPDFQKFAVYADTVGQYTGLTDKNGKMIFEGDIVMFNRGRNLPNTRKSPEVIIYHQGDCAFQRYPYCRYITKSGAGKLIQPDMMSECEIIGNIYDNPELLKGE